MNQYNRVIRTVLNNSTLSTTIQKKMSTIVSGGIRPKVLVTSPELPKSAIDLLKIDCDVTICQQSDSSLPEPTRNEILSKCKGMDGILWATHCRLDAEALDIAGPQLKAISTKSAGIDYVDIPEVKKRGIKLGHTPGVLNNAVADIAIGLMLAAARRFHEGRLKIEQNEWDLGPAFLLGQDIVGSTVGIVGLGGIGQTIGKRLIGFDIAKLLYTGNSKKPEGDAIGAKFVSMDELLKESDFVIVSCPLNKQTTGLFNADKFSKMKPTSVFVNVARGGIVVQDDLIAALKNGTIFSAGLDVMVPEPLPTDHPLLNLSNCVLIPHLGTATKNTELKMAILAVQNVLNGLIDIPMPGSVC